MERYDYAFFFRLFETFLHPVTITTLYEGWWAGGDIYFAWRLNSRSFRDAEVRGEKRGGEKMTKRGV